MAQTAHQCRKLFRNKVFCKRIIKIFLGFFPLHPALLYGQDYEKQRGHWTNYQSLFALQNMLEKIHFLMIYHLCNFDDLIKRGLWAVPKITLGNLCKPIIIVIIPDSSDHVHLDTVERKRKKYKKYNISKLKIPLYREWKSFFLSKL